VKTVSTTQEVALKHTVVRLVLPLLMTFSLASAADNPNIILISVDALRPDHLGCYGYHRDTSPTLDSLANHGIIFENAFSSAAWTSPGLISLLTGRSEPAHGVTTREKNLTPGTSTIAAELRKHGYHAPDICYLIGAPNYQNLGFEEFPQKADLLTVGHDILFHWLREYATRSQPFFLYYHYRDLHQPYNPGTPFDTMFLPDGKPPTDPVVRERFETVRNALLLPSGSINFEPGDTSWITGLYDGELAQFDRQFLWPVITKLRTLGIDSNTMVIITADHGEELLDHGAVGHASTSLTSSIFDECLRIPLIIVPPRRDNNPIREHSLVSIIDVMPTILDYLSLDIPDDVQGHPLTAAFRGGKIENNMIFVSSVLGGYQATKEMQQIHLRAVRTPFWKLIRRDVTTEGSTRWLYDLTGDPGEHVDVSSDYHEIADSLEARLIQWLEESRRIYSTPLWATPDAGEDVSTPTILYPQHGDSLLFKETRGSIEVRLSTTGGSRYTIGYTVGTDEYHVEGTIDSTPEGVRFGPFSPTFWSTLVRYNPWTFRVFPEGKPEMTTDWITFYLSPVE